MELVDSHCHFDFPAFDADRAEVRERCVEQGLSALVIPGVTAATWERAARMAAGDPLLHHAEGLHPVFFDAHEPDTDLATLARRLDGTPEGARPVAIGEIGLDFRHPYPDHAAQEALLDAQLAIARDHHLPVIIHCVRAHHRLVGRLRRWGGPGGVIHAFNGSAEEARAYVDSGFRLGIGGLVTHARNRRLRDIVAGLPAEALLLETDAPDMPPEGHAGERNSPEHLPAIAAAVAACRGERVADVARYTAANTRSLFGLGST